MHKTFEEKIIELILKYEYHDNYTYTDYPQTKEHLNNLKYLSLIAVDNSLPIEIFELVNLKQLNLGQSNVEQLPKEIGNLINLEALSMDLRNLRNTLPRELFELPNLKFLDLSMSYIENLPTYINSMKKIKELYLCGLSLRSLPVELFELISLEILDISENGEIETIHNEIINLNLLKTINISYTNINNIIDVLQGLSSLDVIIISKEQINQFKNVDFIHKIWIGDINNIDKETPLLQHLENSKNYI